MKDEELSGRWASLRKEVMEHGVRNSLISAAYSIYFSNFGNNEAFEPYTSNIYTRRVLR
jgi:ribonucleoside-diphosphate reductase alpha chain